MKSLDNKLRRGRAAGAGGERDGSVLGAGGITQPSEGEQDGNRGDNNHWEGIKIRLIPKREISSPSS